MLLGQHDHDARVDVGQVEAEKAVLVEQLGEIVTVTIPDEVLFASGQTMILETADSKEPETVDEELLHMRKLLKTPLNDLDLSVRAYNCLKAADVKTLGDLVRLEISDMMKFRNFGKKSLAELEQLVAEKSLTFGMDLSKYKLEEE